MSDLETTRRDGILTVTLNRPEKRNALSTAMLGELHQLFEKMKADEATRVVVLRGNGASFCSGLDLAELAAAKQKSGAVSLTDITDVFGVLEAVPQPTIAMVQGDAIAGGCELAMHCDLRIAAEDVKFAMPLTRLGLALPLALVQKLVDTIGKAATKELFFTGERFGADRVVTLGMVNRLVPLAELEATTYRLAETIAKNAPLSVRYFKRAVDRTGSPQRVIDRHDLDEEMAGIGASEDVAEGVAAMREKRPPKFRGR
jgi:enoyl-CoA hydratase/carnithine racemase